MCHACPFVIHDEFRAGSVRDAGGFTEVWRQSELFPALRAAAVGAGAWAPRWRQLRRSSPRRRVRMAAKFFHGPAARRQGPDSGVRQRPLARRLAGVGADRLRAAELQRWTTPARGAARSPSSALPPTGAPIESSDGRTITTPTEHQ